MFEIAIGLVALAAALAVFLIEKHSRLFSARFRFSRRAADRLVLLFAAAYALVFSTLSILRHLAYNTGGFDLGIFDQIVWNSLNGRLMELTIINDTRSFLGVHFSPLLIALVPLYALWSSPLTLLVVQTLALVVGVFPLYWFARARVGLGLAVAVSAAYLLSAPLQHINLFQFHEIALVTPLLAFAAFFLLRENHRAFLVCLALALLVKEEVGAVAVGMGIYVLVIQRRRMLGIALTLFGGVWTLLLLQWLIPFFRGVEFGGSFYFFGSGLGAGVGRYDYLGNSLPEILKTFLLRPQVVLAHLLIPSKLQFLAQLLAPLAFLPLVGAEVAALALPTLVFSLLSDYDTQYSIRYQYTAPLLPFLFFAVVVGTERVLRWKRVEASPARGAWTRALGILILVASLLGYFFLGPGPLAQNFNASSILLNAHTALGSEFERLIPPRASVVAQTELTPHLSERERIYEFPGIPDYRQADYLIGDRTRFWFGFHRGIWENWLASEYFEMVREQDGYFVAKRRAPANSLEWQFDNQMTLRGYTIPVTTTLRGGMTLRPIVEWRAEQDLAENYIVNVHLLDSRGHLWARDDREPQEGNLPTRKWKPGALIGDQFALALPSTLPPGEYRLTVSVCDAKEQCLRVRDASGKDIGDEPMFAAVKLEKDKTSITASQLQIEFPYFVDMGELRLLGYNSIPKEAFLGETVSLGVYWRARSKPRGDYEVAVQLRDASGRVAFEQSDRPAAGAYPTTAWEEGEVLLDWHDIRIPENFPQGEYNLAVVLRQVASVSPLGEVEAGRISLKRN